MREDDKVDPIEAQIEAQIELASLHRQYRCMSNDKRTYTTETQNIIRRQKVAIEKLLREKKELLSLRNVAGRLWNQWCDENNVNALNKLLDKEKIVHREIAMEKELIEKTDEAEKILERKIIARRRSTKACLSQAKYIATQKQVRVMKNRLDNVSKKFNFAMAGNQKLREKIDDVIIQKDHFQTLYLRLEQKLTDVKFDIETVSEATTAHFHSRDEAQHRMASLRERGERELNMFNSDVKDFMRAIAHDRKLQDFMNAKAKDRTNILREEIMTRELRKLGVHLDGLNLEADKYEKIFEKIKEATGIYDTDTLVSSFIEKEDTNFALFNYVNSMGTEIEGYQEDILFLKKEMDMIEKEGRENDVRRQEILKELQTELERIKSHWTALNKEAKADRHILELSKSKVEKLFKTIKCDRTVISELLGGGTSIDDNNAIQYLGIIEQKCNELLQIKALHRLKVCGEVDPKEGHVLEGLLQGAGPQKAQPVLSIVPPNIDEETDLMLQASDEKPLSMDDVQVLFTQAVQRGGISRGAGTGTSKPEKKKKTNIKT